MNKDMLLEEEAFENIKYLHKECGDAELELFQKSDYMYTLKLIQNLLNSENYSSKPKKSYVAKIPFQQLSKGIRKFNNEEVTYFYNVYDKKSDDGSEHMWICIKDINFEEKTICGILANEPLFFDIKMGSIVIARFEDIESIQKFN